MRSGRIDWSRCLCTPAVRTGRRERRAFSFRECRAPRSWRNSLSGCCGTGECRKSRRRIRPGRRNRERRGSSRCNPWWKRRRTRPRTAPGCPERRRDGEASYFYPAWVRPAFLKYSEGRKAALVRASVASVCRPAPGIRADFRDLAQMSEPKGQMARRASLKLCSPSGIPTTVTQ